MKWIIYSLLLVNISIFVWHYQSSGVIQQRVQLTETGNEEIDRLQLVSEQSQQQTDSKRWCNVLGPFDGKGDATQKRGELDNLSISTQLVRTKENKRDGYWVFLPPAKNRKTANLSIKKIKEAGIKDYFLVATGSKANAISLGVFSMTESAKRRVAQLKKQGFEPKIEKVKLPKVEYWLEWTKDSKALLDEANRQSLLKNTSLTISEKTCLSSELKQAVKK